MNDRIKLRIEIIRSAVGVKGKIIVLLFCVMEFLTYPIWTIWKFNKYKLFFISDVMFSNSDGIFIYKKNSSGGFLCIPESFENQLRKYFVLEKGEGFIDVGSNIGKYTVMIGRKYSGTNILSIEAEKSNFINLMKNVKLNKLKNCVCVQCAASDKTCTVKLSIGHFDSGVSSITSNVGSTMHFVKSDTLDNLVKSYGMEKIGLIKIDVEGAEYNVLRGMKNILCKHQPRVLIEIHSHDNLFKCKSFLKKFDYRLDRIIDNHFIAKKVKTNKWHLLQKNSIT